ncbi:MAG: hypothetical protein GEV03_24430 [Streptosporangiales bacterium]|nr:hypothetical protein [Streptosporangiales bacterium]
MLCLVLAFVGYRVYVRVHPYLLGSGCAVRTEQGSLALDIEQAANAATVAAVGVGERVPRRAVTIALATAFQESHLRNLTYGDRDSVGLFQQRPSQGWGTTKNLLDPVYSSRRFYRALLEVDGYRELPVHEAAQRVQRSADGSAYAKHETRAMLLTKALTGRIPAAVHCWYPEQRPDRTVDAFGELSRSFGVVAASAGGVGAMPDGDEAKQVSVPNERRGWTVAAWMVTHAYEYGIPRVLFGGYAWTADAGHDGWRETPAHTPARSVRVS